MGLRSAASGEFLLEAGVVVAVVGGVCRKCLACILHPPVLASRGVMVPLACTAVPATRRGQHCGFVHTPRDLGIQQGKSTDLQPGLAS